MGHPARLLREHLRPDDVIARLGGGEFVALLHGDAAGEITFVAAERLRLAVPDRRLHAAKAARWLVTIPPASAPGKDLAAALNRSEHKPLVHNDLSLVARQRRLNENTHIYVHT